MEHKDMHVFEGVAYEVGDSIVITIPANARDYFGIKKGSKIRVRLLDVKK